MGFFGSKQLPTTSYGYQPPAGATAKGWVCTNRDCGVSEHEFVKRWPKQCPQCGSATDPLFDEPWWHDAEGVELQWILRNDPTRGGGFHQDQWEVWQFKDAAMRSDAGAVAQARVRARAHAQTRLASEDHWIAGYVFGPLVDYALQVRDLNGAADDLCFWLSVSSSENAETDNTNRTNCRQVISASSEFLAAPGGATHSRAPEIRQACVRLAEGAYQVLNRDLQAAVRRMVVQN